MGGFDADLQEKQASYFSLFNVAKVLYVLRDPPRGWNRIRRTIGLMTASMNRTMQRITKGSPRRKLFITLALCALTLLAANWARARDTVAEIATGAQEHFAFFSFMTSSHYATYERVALWCVLGVAFAGLGYALMLISQVKNADTGTPKMQAVADAVRAGANAYLREQFKKIVILIVILTVVLFATAMTGNASWLRRRLRLPHSLQPRSCLPCG